MRARSPKNDFKQVGTLKKFTLRIQDSHFSEPCCSLESYKLPFYISRLSRWKGRHAHTPYRLGAERSIRPTAHMKIRRATTFVEQTSDSSPDHHIRGNGPNRLSDKEIVASISTDKIRVG
ncbi:hypothetical protein AVEN_192019-1 [Araneus ventricosus]|uniref:Uncharacterized protein n=1 Tax=Araneus ventricosus TaxID=182803 RepID=A0A4Y2B9R9_ARAVE|nr:hypothetical protein AVEN_192019-1 [Araneus ventricosus]